MCSDRARCPSASSKTSREMRTCAEPGQQRGFTTVVSRFADGTQGVPVAVLPVLVDAAHVVVGNPASCDLPRPARPFPVRRELHHTQQGDPFGVTPRLRVVGRGELTNRAWARIAPVLPSETGRRGGRWRGHRQVIDGILWKERTDAPWRGLSERYGPWRPLTSGCASGPRTGRETGSWST
jgi:putative transposase of IS4/5 family DUF4096